MEEIDIAGINSITPEISINSSTPSVGLLKAAEIGLYSFSFLLGIPIQSYVIWLIITGTGSGIAAGFFNLNFSVCEIGDCLYCLVDLISTWFRSLLPLSQFLLALPITGRPLFQCLICVERFLAVVHPVIFLKFKPLRYRVICSTAAWIICLGSCLCCMFFVHSLNTLVWFSAIQYLIFLFVQLFCCLAVLRALKQSGPGERGREREEENHMKRRAFNIILITTLSTVIMYAPFTIGGFFILTQHNIQGLFLIGFICFVLAGFVQPVLYLHRIGKLSCLFSP